MASVEKCMDIIDNGGKNCLMNMLIDWKNI